MLTGSKYCRKWTLKVRMTRGLQGHVVGRDKKTPRRKVKLKLSSNAKQTWSQMEIESAEPYGVFFFAALLAGLLSKISFIRKLWAGR